MNLPMILDTHKRVDQSANVQVAAHRVLARYEDRRKEWGKETYTMITRYRASRPIIVICFDNDVDVDVDEARNLARRNATSE